MKMWDDVEQEIILEEIHVPVKQPTQARWPFWVILLLMLLLSELMCIVLIQRIDIYLPHKYIVTHRPLARQQLWDRRDNSCC
jgi:hypothetical protein